MDKKIIRKIKEILLAFQIESKFEKDEILELYLNKAYMGNGAWGIGAASRVYFSKQISQFTKLRNGQRKYTGTKRRNIVLSWFS